jgi:hypothetical protein
MPPCTFDEVTHTYTIAGRPVPSVTGIVSAALGPIQYGSEWHMERGTAIHKAAEIILQGRIPRVDPRIQGHVDAVQMFVTREVAAVIEIERQVYSVRLRYAGTLDLIADTQTCGRCIMDWKSSGDVTRTAIQMAGYALAWEEMTGERIKTGIMVELGEDGRYKASVVKLDGYANQFKACLTVANIKRNL